MSDFELSRRQILATALAAAPLVALAQGATGTTRPSQKRSPQGRVWNHDEVALVLIDYQPDMFSNIRSEVPADLVELNTRFLIRVAKALNIPVVLSTVGVELGVNRPTAPAILAELPGVTPIDRSTMNAWEDGPFRSAVLATKKKRIVMLALYTEICLTYPVIEAMKEGFEVTIVTDAVGGMSQLAHATAITRMTHAGAVPNTATALTAEFFRDWKSAEAEKVRPILVWYLGEIAKRGPGMPSGK